MDCKKTNYPSVNRLNECVRSDLLASAEKKKHTMKRRVSLFPDRNVGRLQVEVAVETVFSLLLLLLVGVERGGVVVGCTYITTIALESKVYK